MGPLSGPATRRVLGGLTGGRATARIARPWCQTPPVDSAGRITVKAERQKGKRAALSRGRMIVLSVVAVIVAIAVVEGFAATSVETGPRPAGRIVDPD